MDEILVRPIPTPVTHMPLEGTNVCLDCHTLFRAFQACPSCTGRTFQPLTAWLAGTNRVWWKRG